MNTKKIANLDLLPKVASSGTIQLIEFTAESLTALNWLDAKGWPTDEFARFIRDLDVISPTEFGHNATFWDQIGKGFSVYNRFLENGSNE